MKPLTAQSVSGILHLGGTILGSSRTNPLKREEDMQNVLDTMVSRGLDGLVAIGGDDTLSVAAGLYERGGKAVGVPKTMDNDIGVTEYCIGFNSAVTTVVDALDKLHTTASSHHRVIVLEVMGRYAGWVAVTGGIAGGADYIIVPERQTDLDEVVAHLKFRKERGKSFSIIVVAEGATVVGMEERRPTDVDAFGHIRLDRRNLGERIAEELERLTDFETRSVVLGHIQRGGTASVIDRLQASRLGVAAVDYVNDGRFGYMPAIVGGKVVPVLLRDAIATTRTVDPELLELARVFY